MMCGRISSVFVAKEPADTAFTLEVLGPSPPFAVRAGNDAKAIFYFELFVLDVKLVVAFGTDKESRVGYL